MSDTRFFRWFRTIPIMVMLALCVVTAGIGIAPAKVVRKVLYPVRYAEIIKSASQRYGVDEYLVCAVVKCESNWDPNVTSSAGAVGLMQMMPSTSAEVARLGLVDSRTYNPNDLTDPATNIEYGTAYLAYLQRNLKSQDEVIAAYNAGLGSVSQWTANGGNVNETVQFAATASYLVRVNDAQGRYRQLYPDGIENSGSLF